jgi:hypothetical protein
LSAGRVWLVLSFVALSVASSHAYEIGYTSVTYVDPDRGNRQVDTEIYYPADTPGQNVPVATPPIGGFPVVSFGHGYLISWDDYDFLWEGLVPGGCVVAFPQTGGELFPEHLEFGLDLAFVSRAVRAESSSPSSLFYGALSQAAAVGGHSMGGGASFLGAAADTSITALFNLAAAETNPSAVAAAGQVTVPALVFSGSLDCVTPPADHQVPMYDALSSDCRTRVTLLGGSHCQFAEDNFFCNLGEGGCPDPTISRTRQHTLTLTLLDPWLAAVLRDNPQSWGLFQSVLDTLSGVTYVQDCPLSTVGSEDRAQEAEPVRLAVESAPNPFSHETRVRFNTPHPGRVVVDIYSIHGRRLRRLADRDAVRGSHTIVWDGRDSRGRLLAPGVYLYRVTHERQTATGRLILVR